MQKLIKPRCQITGFAQDPALLPNKIVDVVLIVLSLVLGRDERGVSGNDFVVRSDDVVVHLLQLALRGIGEFLRFFELARLAKAVCSSSSAMRSGVASKLSFR